MDMRSERIRSEVLYRYRFGVIRFGQDGLAALVPRVWSGPVTTSLEL
jgi:hypothetical protein